VRALLVPVGADWYAVAMSSVREVLSRPRPTAVPTTPAAVLGLFNLRGEIVPLFDTAALLGLGSTPDGPYAAVVLTTLGPAGLVATGVPESVELGEPVSRPETSSGLGCYAVGSRLATLLDVDALLMPGHREVRSS
jgi:purine-binding chemotaxis protein CheW